MKVIDSTEMVIDYRIPRSAFEEHFWSANIVNFNPERMVQHSSGKAYTGQILVVQSERASTIPVALHGLAEAHLTLAGVEDGFNVGAFASQLVKKHGTIYVPGTIGTPNWLDYFCPQLFMFGEAVSYGIERLEPDARGDILIPKGALCLARQIIGESKI